ncbi:hypothetical protein SDC9_100080 [bioreactor metagenome]|uniref:Uncharacterized protein n=1 Tax=bioreactor metagenome TaxID=1076179 RepID=A0A645AR33_9ZZZZ
MIVHHANCLQEGIDNHRPDKFKATLFQVFADLLRQLCFCGNFCFATPTINNGFVPNILPQEIRKTAKFLFYVEHCHSVVSDRFKLC